MQQVFYVEELYLLIELINQLLIIEWYVCVAITKIIKYVSEVCAVSINKVASIFILDHIVPTREHCSQHGIWV